MKEIVLVEYHMAKELWNSIIIKCINNKNVRYTGSWKEGKFDGKGILTISEEETYEGEF